ncbi:uncharacterized G-patch domain protein DDB_G0278987-like [Nylanderia fulva]|uniref:uncharacterized G-patch domain protein DDB_G0278987-like n=1 Tax=Nylanderia fulva TaxID=613905 RepID=UPI0010FB112A|nr:uncharacterized G-patch domain protein DDB_G0278987-like [Nylanderia fulva]XP_029163874.1 uncharacterized G-patch domain protein DDB_G0278987-like [Nylanderia fulva]
MTMKLLICSGLQKTGPKKDQDFEYDDAVRGLKKAEDNTSLETEADNAPRRRKPPKRYIDDSDEDSEDKENTLPSRKEKVYRKSKIRKLSESSSDNGSETLPEINSDALKAVKDSIHLNQVQDKEMEKVTRKESVLSVHKNIEFRVQKFQDNSSQDSERKQRQLQKIRGNQSQSNIKKHEKQQEMDHTKQKFLSVSSKDHTSLNSKTSTILSPPDFTSDDAQDSLSLHSMRINNPDKGSSCSLVQTSAGSSSGTNEEHFSLPNTKANQSYSYNFKNKGDGCKHCHSE